MGGEVRSTVTERKPPFRDGLVHVLAEQCSTCIFRPGNLMNLSEGRLKDIVAGNLKADSGLVCHKTLTGMPMHDNGEALCRGFFDRYDTTPIRLAKQTGLIREVPETTEVSGNQEEQA